MARGQLGGKFLGAGAHSNVQKTTKFLLIAALVIVAFYVSLFAYLLRPYSGLQLVYEGNGSSVAKDFFFKGEVVQLEFRDDIGGNSPLDFYLVPYGQNSSSVLVYSTTTGRSEVKFSVNTSSLPLGLYEVLAKSGGEVWNCDDPSSPYNYERYPWLIAVMQPFQTGQPAPGLPPLTVPYGLGVNIHFDNPNAEQQEYLRMASLAGFKLVRMDMYLAPAYGNWTTRFAGYFPLAQEEREDGLRPLFILDEDPLPNASPNTGAWRDSYAQFAGNATLLFSPYDPVWEIWNEPNSGGAGYPFWQGYTEADFAEAASSAIERVATAGGTAIAPATAGLDPGSENWTWAFLRDLSPEALRDLAAVSVHPYRGSDPETASADYYAFREMIGWAKPVVCSEWGYPTEYGGYSALTQAQYYCRMYLTDLMNGVPITVLYDLQDDGTSASNPEDCFGLVQSGAQTFSSGGPLNPEVSEVYFVKPSYYALFYLSYSLNGFSFCRAYVNGTPFSEVSAGRFRYMLNASSTNGQGVYLLEFRRGDSVRYVVWSTVGEVSYELPGSYFNSTAITVSSVFGETHRVNASPSGFSLMVGETPEVISAG